MRIERKALLIALLCCGVAVPAHAAAAGADLAAAPGVARESGDREADDGLSAKVSKAFWAGDYAALERLAAQLRSKGDTAPSGAPLIRDFYVVSIKALVNGVPLDRADVWNQALKKADDWMHQYPRSPTPILAKSELLLTYGWNARGNGYSNTVSDQGWQGFKESMQKSRELLTSTKNISSQDPDWYRQMLALCKNLSLDGSEVQSITDATLKRFPSYFPAFLTGAEYMLPKWGGSDESVRNYIHYVADSAPPGMGDILYARLYADLSCCNYRGPDIFDHAGAEWPRLRTGLESIRHQYPDPENVDFEAALACKAGDRKTLNALLPLVNGQPILDSWSKDRSLYERCAGMAKSAP